MPKLAVFKCNDYWVWIFHFSRKLSFPKVYFLLISPWNSHTVYDFCRTSPAQFLLDARCLANTSKEPVSPLAFLGCPVVQGHAFWCYVRNADVPYLGSWSLCHNRGGVVTVSPFPSPNACPCLHWTESTFCLQVPLLRPFSTLVHQATYSLVFIFLCTEVLLTHISLADFSNTVSVWLLP